jgi:hypothetical protein
MGIGNEVRFRLPLFEQDGDKAVSSNSQLAWSLDRLLRGSGKPEDWWRFEDRH